MSAIAALHGGVDLAREARPGVQARPPKRHAWLRAQFNGPLHDAAPTADASVGVALAWFGLFAMLVVRALL
jgi:hypothetical protein